MWGGLLDRLFASVGVVLWVAILNTHTQFHFLLLILFLLLLIICMGVSLAPSL